MTAAEYRRTVGRTGERFGKMRNKFNAKRTAAPDGSRTYDSKREAAVCEGLRRLEKVGIISDLVLQPKYPLVVNGRHVADVIPDCRFRDENGHIRIQDVKSTATRTAVFRLKAKLFAALYPGLEIEVVE